MTDATIDHTTPTTTKERLSLVCRASLYAFANRFDVPVNTDHEDRRIVGTNGYLTERLHWFDSATEYQPPYAHDSADPFDGDWAPFFANGAGLGAVVFNPPRAFNVLANFDDYFLFQDLCDINLPIVGLRLGKLIVRPYANGGLTLRTEGREDASAAQGFGDCGRLVTALNKVGLTDMAAKVLTITEETAFEVLLCDHTLKELGFLETAIRL